MTARGRGRKTRSKDGSPSTPRACGATLRASGVDRSARPSKEGYHAMNADTRLALFNRTYDVLNKGNCPIENAAKKNSTKKLLTCGAPYKPPALPGDSYLGRWFRYSAFSYSKAAASSIKASQL